MREFQSINLELFYVFNKVSEIKSINKASELLLMTQPGISKKIKQLEEYFGVSLFERNSKGVRLTPDGRILYKFSKSLINDINNCKKIFDKKISTLDSIQLGILESISTNNFLSFVVDNVNKFNKLNITASIPLLVQDLNYGLTDAVIMDSDSRIGITGKYYEKKIISEPYYLVFSKNNSKVLTKISEVVCAEDLSCLHLILYPKYCPIHQKVITILKFLNKEIPDIYEISSSESTIEIVKNTNFVTVLPKLTAIKKVEENKKYLSLRPLDTNFDRSISIFSRHDSLTTFIYNQLTK